jgi:hypothetical protein
MKIVASLLLVAFVTTTACAHDVHATYPRASLAAGVLEVALNAPTGELTVAVNGDMVVDRKHSRRARIDGVPAGRNLVRVVTSGSCEQSATTEKEVHITPGQVTTLALPAPDSSLACAVFDGLYYVGLNIGIAAVTVALVATGRSRGK